MIFRILITTILAGITLIVSENMGGKSNLVDFITLSAVFLIYANQRLDR